MQYISHAWRAIPVTAGYSLEFEECTDGDISRFEIRAEILEEWKYCETANEVYRQTNYAKYSKWRNQLKRTSK